MKTRPEKVLGNMILLRIEKIKKLMSDASSLNQSNKRYRSTTARIVEDIYEITEELEDLEPEYHRATKGAYDDMGISDDIMDGGYDLDDEEFLSMIKRVNFKKTINFVKKRQK